MSSSLFTGDLSTVTATRTACVLVPNWPLTAALEVRERAGIAVPEYCALMEQHRVHSASSAAARAGVAPGMKKRAAQALSPELVLIDRDHDSEWSVSEAVAAAVDTVASGVECIRPGMFLIHARGPARHAGGEAELAGAIVDAVANLTGWECTVGVADGPLAAVLAASVGRIVRSGESARFLAPYPLESLEYASLTQSERFRPSFQRADSHENTAETFSLLHRLGVHTLGDFAALPVSSVVERFGPSVALSHLLARGGEPSEPPRHRAAQPILVERTLDPPLERVDQAAFVARPMAEELAQKLRSRGEVCTRLRIVARSEHGDEWERTWRHDGALSVADVVDRVRWQSDGWIRAASLERPRAQEKLVRAGALVHLQLIPLQLVSASNYAPGLWGRRGEKAERAQRALTRVQSLAGEQSVLVIRPGGGRLASEAVRLHPFRSADTGDKAPAPWVGSIPAPFPTTVFNSRPHVQLLDSRGSPVMVTARGLLNAVPASLVIEHRETAPATRTTRKHAELSDLDHGRALTITAYGAPVVIDQRWWEPSSPGAHRGARLQVIVDSSHALLLLSREGTWEVEAFYD